MEITTNLLDELTVKAKASSRLRISYDLRNSTEDNSQRVLNAMEPGTIVDIHRHQNSSESAAVIRGKIKLNIYDNDGTVTESFVVSANSPLSFYVLPIGTWHNCEVIESGTIMFEAKDGKYAPATSDDLLQSKDY